MAWRPLADIQAEAKYNNYLVTIPHTGTFFTIGVLESMGLKYEIDFLQQHIEFYSREQRESWRDYAFQLPWIIHTMRDPMMAIISSINQGQTDTSFNQLAHSVETWKLIAKHKDAPNVHFFRVDCPVAERDQELRDLATFCRSRTLPTTDWAPVHASPDVRTLKPGYASGTRKLVLRTHYQMLQGSPAVKTLFADHGYSLPWMA